MLTKKRFYSVLSFLNRYNIGRSLEWYWTLMFDQSTIMCTVFFYAYKNDQIWKKFTILQELIIAWTNVSYHCFIGNIIKADLEILNYTNQDLYTIHRTNGSKEFANIIRSKCEESSKDNTTVIMISH